MLLLSLIWMWMVGLDVWLMYELLVKAPREVKEWEVVLAWKQHFQEEVPSHWVFYDGLGG